MPITQIPFQDPVAPPEKPGPEQLGLYDQQDWEAAYRELDARVPHLVIQLQDDLQRSRKREAAWISIIVHLLLIFGLWNLPLIQKTMGWHRVVAVPVNPLHDQNATFLALPPDLQKLTRKPKTNIASDKDRIAMTKHPELDPKDLRNTLVSPPPGAPGMRGPRAVQPAAPQQPAIAPSQAPMQQQQQAPPQQRPQFQTDQTAQLQTPLRQNNSFSKYSTGMSASAAMQQATQAAAAQRAGGGGQEGDFGFNAPAHGRQYGAVQVLTDTQGVDFGPYIARVLQDLKANWIHLTPESAAIKHGKLVIDFGIMPDGHVQGLVIRASSGDPALDRPAYGSVLQSNPFSPLPKEFTGPYLGLRILFIYNPEKGDLE